MPTFLYLRPHRERAIESAVVAALALGERDEGGPVPARFVANAVARFFPWSRQTEIRRAILRMVRAGRVPTTTPEGRSLPAFVLA